MTFKQYSYATTPSNLEGIDWVTDNVYVQLLNVTHTYNSAHDTRTNIISAITQNPVQLTGKTKTIAGVYTYLSATQIQFPSGPSAKYISFLVGDASTPGLSDKLLGLIDLNDGVDAEVTVDFGVGFNGGLFTLKKGA